MWYIARANLTLCKCQNCWRPNSCDHWKPGPCVWLVLTWPLSAAGGQPGHTSWPTRWRWPSRGAAWGGCWWWGWRHSPCSRSTCWRTGRGGGPSGPSRPPATGAGTGTTGWTLPQTGTWSLSECPHTAGSHPPSSEQLHCASLPYWPSPHFCSVPYLIRGPSGRQRSRRPAPLTWSLPDHRSCLHCTTGSRL